MKRTIVNINEEKCIGCGLCITACQQGAIILQDGKARLVSEDYCDGLGMCLPKCPVDAIVMEEREALPFDQEASLRRKADNAAGPASLDQAPATSQPMARPLAGAPTPCTASFSLRQEQGPGPADSNVAGAGQKLDLGASDPQAMRPGAGPSQLQQWPVQIKLMPLQAPYLDGAKLLVAADCTAYAYSNFHQDFMKDKVTIIGCPKLDEGDYTDKLAAIIAGNDIKSLSIVKMEVPCCNGLLHACRNALIKSGKMIPWSIKTITTDGGILDE